MTDCTAGNYALKKPVSKLFMNCNSANGSEKTQENRALALFEISAIIQTAAISPQGDAPMKTIDVSNGNDVLDSLLVQILE